jgi:hypothetical protein
MYHTLRGSVIELDSDQIRKVCQLEERVDRELSRSSEFYGSGWWTYYPEEKSIKFNIFPVKQSGKKSFNVQVSLDEVLCDPDSVLDKVLFRVLFDG